MKNLRSYFNTLIAASVTLVLFVGLMAPAFSAAPAPPADPRLKAYYDYLVSIDHCPYNIGFLLEEVIRMELMKEYDPSVYDVTGGLELYAPDGFSIGEIDILVMRKSDHKVMLIGEAKMWKDLAAGLEKAQSQLKKLKDAIENKKFSRLYFKPDPDLELGADIFDGDVKYATYSSKGGVAVGFDREIDITTSEGAMLADLVTIKHYEKVDYDKVPNYKKYLEILKKFKNLPRDDKTLFLIVAKAHILDKYPPSAFMTMEDLAYFDAANEELGHVKLAVQDKATGKIVYIGNVVYGWNDPAQGLKVYTRFLKEFSDAVADGKIAKMTSARPANYSVAPENAQGIITYEIIGEKGTKKLGFQREIDVDEDVIYWLRCKVENRI